MRRPIIPNIVGSGAEAVQQLKRHIMRLYEEANDIRRMVFFFEDVDSSNPILVGQDWPLLRSTQFLRLGYRYRYTGTGGDTIDIDLDTKSAGGSFQPCFQHSNTPGAAGTVTGTVDTVVATGRDYKEEGDEWRLDINCDANQFVEIAVEILYADWTPRLR